MDPIGVRDVTFLWVRCRACGVWLFSVCLLRVKELLRPPWSSFYASGTRLKPRVRMVWCDPAAVAAAGVARLVRSSL